MAHDTAEPFDAILIGAGQGGPGVLTHLAGAGKAVALVEADKVGGTCLNRGCRPSKALRASARVAQIARTASRHGVHTGEITIDFAAVMARKDALIDRWLGGYEDDLDGVDGLTMVRGAGRFVGTHDGRHHVAVGDRVLAAPTVILNTGTRATVPPVVGDVPYLDNDSVLHLAEPPERLVVLGGGYIALELGQIFQRLGSAVTIIERGAQVAGREDTEISELIAKVLVAEGLDVRTGTTIEQVEREGSGIAVVTSAGERIVGSHLLVALGRTPNTDQLGLDTVGLAADEHGMIATDGVFRTAVPGIFAVGDINGRGAFTHTSYQDGEILVDHLTGGTRSADDRIPTYAMFTDPPLGRVGVSDREAAASGRNVLRASLPFHRVTRAALDAETDGVMSVLVDADSERFLGATVFGVSGDEIVQLIGALMYAEASYHVLADMLPVHPTVAEFFPTLLAGLEPLAP